MSSRELAPGAQVTQLYLHHQNWLQGWFAARLDCPEQSADLTQDVFLRVLRRQESLRQESLRQPKAFLRVIAKGLLIDFYRRRSVERAFLEALAALPETYQMSAEERQMLLDTLDEIDAMLDRMPAKVRHAFLRAQLDGLTYVEIAQEMEVSVRSVKRYMRDAYARCLRYRLNS
ncbi:MAG: sigma-70 family RNA polymerase sigma factor [Pseudomonadota bacterium]